MNKTKGHIAPYTAADIQKYLDGKLSAAEMHRMEKAALEDPFLADAMDGFSNHAAGQPVIEQDLADLRERLDKRVDQKKRKTLPLLTRIAAAVVILVGLGLIARYGLQKTTTADIAQTPAAGPASKPAPEKAAQDQAAQADSITIETPKAAASAPGKPSTTWAPGKSARTDSASSQRALVSTYSGQPAPAHQKVDPPTPAGRTNTATLTRKPAVQTASTSAPAALKAKSFALKKESIGGSNQSWANFGKLQPSASFNNAFAVTGVVIDQNNKPLPGATLFLNGNENGYVTTNQEGGFKLPLAKKDSSQQLNVYLSGYKAASVDIQSLETEATPAVIRLQPQRNNLEEVVVTGYGKSRKETRVEAPSEDNDEKLDSFWLKATPIIGRINYLQYLIAGKATIHADTSIKGDVLISFDVDRQGQLNDFKIEQSLSPIHDAGVIRLISEGPHWRLLKGRHTRALVKVSF